MRILALLFILATALMGCTDKHSDDGQDESRRALGMESKMGKELAAKEFCGPLKTDAISKQSTIEALRFSSNSTFVRRTLGIDKQLQLVVERQSRGFWGYLNGTLMLTEDGAQTNLPIVEAVNGTKTCFQIGEAQQLYCPCE